MQKLYYILYSYLKLILSEILVLLFLKKTIRRNIWASFLLYITGKEFLPKIYRFDYKARLL